MSVEFLPGDEPGVDGSAPPEHGRGRRRWWPVAALAVLAAVIWAVSRPSLEPARPVPHRTAVASVSVVRVPECRGVPDCSARIGVPAPIAHLARAYLPPGTHLRVRSVIEVDSFSYRDRLVARDIDAQLDSATVQIRVERGGPRRQAIVPDPPGVGSLLLHGTNSGLVVRLQYLAPETVAPQLSRLRALMRDPRLTAA
jgi:hypothetical protein